MPPSPYEGALVRIRAREPRDEPDHYRWYNDIEVTQHIQARYPESTAGRRVKVDLQKPPGYALGLYAIETLDGVHIGRCALEVVSPENRAASLGIDIGHPDYRDGGYGTDAMRVLCRFAFESMNLHRVELHVFATNARAIHVYEKVGFVEEGRLRDSDFRFGGYRDTVVMGLLEGELR